jgi:hypothetical protein
METNMITIQIPRSKVKSLNIAKALGQSIEKGLRVSVNAAPGMQRHVLWCAFIDTNRRMVEAWDAENDVAASRECDMLGIITRQIVAIDSDKKKV